MKNIQSDYYQFQKLLGISLFSVEHFGTNLVSRGGYTRWDCVASLREVTKAFMRFAANVMGRLSMQLCVAKAYCISTRDVASVEKKKMFFICHIWRKHFLFRAFFFNVTHGFHNDQENVEIISFFSFSFFSIDKSIQ